MKRDILLLSLCLCVLAGVNWLGGRRAEPVSAAADLNRGPTLILDAGHGGEDGGASTAAGEKESGINLAIVRKTRSLMVFLGVEPVLTREEDISLHSGGAGRSPMPFLLVYIKITLQIRDTADLRCFTAAEMRTGHGGSRLRNCSGRSWLRTTAERPSRFRTAYTCLTTSAVHPCWWSAAFSATEKRPPCCARNLTSGRSRWHWPGHILHSFEKSRKGGGSRYG